MNNFVKQVPIFTNSLIYFKRLQHGRRSTFSTLFFIFISFVVSIIFYAAIGCPPDIFGKVFSLAFRGLGYGNELIRYFCIYAVAALSFAFAMKTGIFNIGISGQMLAGATTSFLIISTFQNSFHPAQGGQLLTLLFSVIAASTVAVIIGLLKIYFKIHEVVSCILLNWIILLICAHLVQTYMIDGNAWNSGTLKSLPLSESFAFSSHNNFGYAWSVGVTVICSAIVFVLIRYTVFGHKIKTVGLAPSAAGYFGYNTNVLMLSSFAISGALAGVLGIIVYSGSNDRAIDFNGTALNAIPREGFNGIAISMIVQNNTIGILFVSLLFAIFNVGANVYLSGPIQDFTLGLMMYLAVIYEVLDFFKPWLWLMRICHKNCNLNEYRKYQNGVENLCDSFWLNKSISKSKLIHELTANKIRGSSNKLTKLFYNCYFYFAVHFSKDYSQMIDSAVKRYCENLNKIKQTFNLNCAINVINHCEYKFNQTPSAVDTQQKKLLKYLKYVDRLIQNKKVVLDEIQNDKFIALKQRIAGYN